MILHAPSVHFVWQRVIDGVKERKLFAHAEITLRTCYLKQVMAFWLQEHVNQEKMISFKVKRASNYSLC